MYILFYLLFIIIFHNLLSDKNSISFNPNNNCVLQMNVCNVIHLFSANKSDVAGNKNRQDDFEDFKSDLDSDDSSNTSITYSLIYYRTKSKRVLKRLSHGNLMASHSCNDDNDR